MFGNQNHKEKYLKKILDRNKNKDQKPISQRLYDFPVLENKIKDRDLKQKKLFWNSLENGQDGTRKLLLLKPKTFIFNGIVVVILIHPNDPLYSF